MIPMIFFCEPPGCCKQRNPEFETKPKEIK